MTHTMRPRAHLKRRALCHNIINSQAQNQVLPKSFDTREGSFCKGKLRNESSKFKVQSSKLCARKVTGKKNPQVFEVSINLTWHDPQMRFRALRFVGRNFKLETLNFELKLFLHMKEKSLLSFGVEGIFEAHDDVVEANDIYPETSAEEQLIRERSI